MSTPMDWQPSKAIQAKTGACEKKTIPRWVENPKGRSRQKWDDERKMKKKYKKKTTNMQKRWPRMRCPKHLRDCSNKQQYHSDCFSLRCYSLLPSTMVSVYLRTTASPEEELLQICVQARAITCPNIPMFCLSLRNHVYKLPIIMHFKTFIHA